MTINKYIVQLKLTHSIESNKKNFGLQSLANSLLSVYYASKLNKTKQFNLYTMYRPKMPHHLYRTKQTLTVDKMILGICWFQNKKREGGEPHIWTRQYLEMTVAVMCYSEQQ